MSSTPLTERRYVAPFALITSLFFLWAIGVNLNDVLIKHMKKAFSLSDFQSSLIQSAFFGGYFLAALPAGRLMQRVGYKKGILIGLLICATGAFLFIPASTVRVYGCFLFALFVMACGQCFLEVAANPYVTTLGPAPSAERRLNLAQSFNALGAVTIVLLGSRFILSGIEHSAGELAAMTPAQLTAYQATEAGMVRLPYLVITSLFLLVAAVIYFTRLPEIKEEAFGPVPEARSGNIWTHRHLLKGVLAQFFYVGAQVGAASFIIRLAQYSLPGTPEKIAARYLQLHLVGFMIGRFAGSAMMKKVAAPRLLSIFAAGSLLALLIVLASSGQAPVWAVVLLGFFHSIMFPTIFALGIRNLGPLTKLGSSLLVMSIIGGAICPAVMGVISDATNIQAAFVVPLLCHAFIFYFAIWGYKPGAIPAGGPVMNVASSEAE
jgi:FHS family L-fucose permease-like MFS transporter